ncbi:MAG: hypothetical protein U0794_11200 [Isosphaeraceae bacterium]
MDKPSFDSPSEASSVLCDGDFGTPSAGRSDPRTERAHVVVLNLGNDLGDDLVAYFRRDAGQDVTQVNAPAASGVRISAETSSAEAASGPVTLLLLLPTAWTDAAESQLGTLLNALSPRPVTFVGLVGTFRVHLGDGRAEAVEQTALKLVSHRIPEAHVAVFRPSHVLSPRSPTTKWLRRLAPLYPLAPGRLRTCFVEGEVFFAAIDTIRRSATDRDHIPIESEAGKSRAVDSRSRVYTYLGVNTAWRDVLRRHASGSPLASIITVVAQVLAWLLVGQGIALAVSLLGRFSLRAKAWSVSMLRPDSLRELLALCHPGNIDHVRVVGYNNGVHHFGHRHPGRTIVSTVRCNRVVKRGPNAIQADCGATIRVARDYLDARGEELYVVPNYSYVAIGTAFFVPIHGSAVDYATVADTFTRVVLYDPDTDRIYAADRGDAAFSENVYNPRSRVVALRLVLRTRPKSRYFVRRETWMRPDASALLSALQSRAAANVEIRQGHAASPRVTVSTYFTNPDADAGSTSGPALETPRDTLGRLWDVLEENPVSAFLMHALSRHVAWHTELFLTPPEFLRFWETHGHVPLRKIQLRYIRRDGMAHSPFRDDDCVSADLFLFRYDKPAFDAYLARTLPSVRTNPGKHSQ